MTAAPHARPGRLCGRPRGPPSARTRSSSWPRPPLLAAARAEAEACSRRSTWRTAASAPTPTWSAPTAAAGIVGPGHPLLVAALGAAIAAAHETDGLVDPALGRSLEALGYDRDFAELPGRRRPRRAPDAGAASRRLARDGRRPGGRGARARGRRARPRRRGQGIRRRPPGRSIAERLASDCVVSLGGDVASAPSRTPGATRGRWQSPRRRATPRPSWSSSTAAASPRPPPRTGAGGAAAASVHHLLDPRTGRPVRARGARRPWRRRLRRGEHGQHRRARARRRAACLARRARPARAARGRTTGRSPRSAAGRAEDAA